METFLSSFEACSSWGSADWTWNVRSLFLVFKVLFLWTPKFSCTGTVFLQASPSLWSSSICSFHMDGSIWRKGYTLLHVGSFTTVIHFYVTFPTHTVSLLFQRLVLRKLSSASCHENDPPGLQLNLQHKPAKSPSQSEINFWGISNIQTDSWRSMFSALAVRTGHGFIPPVPLWLGTTWELSPK